ASNTIAGVAGPVSGGAAADATPACDSTSSVTTDTKPANLVFRRIGDLTPQRPADLRRPSHRRRTPGDRAARSVSPSSAHIPAATADRQLLRSCPPDWDHRHDHPQWTTSQDR